MPAVLAVAALMLLTHSASAQGLAPKGIPFGIGGGEGAATPSSSVIVAWILAKQSDVYQAINAAVRATKENGSAVFWLAGLSFAYGVFHAAGPGHGKAIIASYMVANENALKRGTAIAFMAAALQGLVAVLIVAVISIVLRGTAMTMTRAAGVIEGVSYAAIAAFGLYLVWRKGLALVATVSGRSPAHLHGPDCDHVHMPEPSTLDHRLSLRETAATVFAAGIRPCTGAILVLVFALSQGIFYAGIAGVVAMSAGTAVTTSGIAALAVFAKMLALKLASGRSRRGAVLVGSLELAAALAVMVLGAGLMLGFFATQGGS